MGQFLFARSCPKAIIQELSCVDCAPLSIVLDNTPIEIYGALEADNNVNLDLSVINLTGGRTARVYESSTYSDGAAFAFYGSPAPNDATSRIEFGNIINCYGRTSLWTEKGRSILTSYCNFYSNQMEISLFWCDEGLVQSDFCYFFGNIFDGPTDSLFKVYKASITVRNCYFEGSLPSGNFYDVNSPCFPNAVCTSFPIYHYYTAFCSGIPRRTTRPFTHSSLFSSSPHFLLSSPHSATAIFPTSRSPSSSVDFTSSSLLTDSVPSIFGIQRSFLRFGLFFLHISFTADKF
jgi:hypothetical protein